MLLKYISWFFFAFTTMAAAGCTLFEESHTFLSLPSTQTGVTFSNDIETTSEFNILNYLYFYDGGGVSIGDVNNDGLSDLYFTANMKSNKLYLNKGNFEFEDITSEAGVAGSGDWTTGTTMADVNGDGLLDIYVCNVNYLMNEGKNELFINNGDGTFTERAEAYGLDFEGYSKQAAFFDYDGDGDLDMYLLNHGMHNEKSFTRADKRKARDPNAGDRLYRNEGDTYTDVTEESGIYSSAAGYGLGVATSDLNSDGCPDIYISNDFHENDYLYRNNCDGTFTEVQESATGHSSRSSMGNDIADINNDGLPDIFVADMLPRSEKGLKTAVSSETYKVYTIQRQFGYHPQLIQNTLQINRGRVPNGQMRFSEIAKYARVDATDWSWAPLLFDINNSGYKDLFVTNGIYRRPNDLDYLLYVRKDETQELINSGDGEDLKVIERMPHTKIPNAGFMNNGNQRFSDRSEKLGFTEPGYSSGAAYGDLDNDGDLDLVINNVNSRASILKNMSRESKKGNNYIQVKLDGEAPNTVGIGSKVTAYDSSLVQKYELYTTRGFISSVEPRITIGMGTSELIDSLEVVWPDGRLQTLYDVPSNQAIVLHQSDAADRQNPGKMKNQHVEPLFKNVSSEIAGEYSHDEDNYTDFNQQQLAPIMLSTEGPGVATGDINNDGLEDFFIGGAKGQAGIFFLQRPGGHFIRSESPVLNRDASYEDVDAALFDANDDDALDLYVVSGGNEFPRKSRKLRDRLYLNDGNGNFARASNVLPPMDENGSVVAAEDFDGDGDMDLFVGSRSVPQNYGVSPRSFLLRNMGNGQFEEVTEEVAPALEQWGMVTDAIWTDLDKDGHPDLIISGEWMPLAIFFNNNGQLVSSDKLTGLNHSHGWWQSLESGDFDNDGDIDFVAGNMGTNSFMKASEEEPIVMYLKDFNRDGQVDPVIGYTRGSAEFPVAPRDELLRMFKFLRPQFKTYREYAGKTIQEIFGGKLTEGAWEKKEVKTLQSVFVENLGDRTFQMHPLPGKAQWAPIYSSLADDFNADGNIDLLTGGNLYEVKPSVGGRFDASYGLFLRGNGDKSFGEVKIQTSGFFVDGQVRDIRQIKDGGKGTFILVARNDQSIMLFRTKKDRH